MNQQIRLFMSELVWNNDRIIQILVKQLLNTDYVLKTTEGIAK